MSNLSALCLVLVTTTVQSSFAQIPQGSCVLYGDSLYSNNEIQSDIRSQFLLTFLYRNGEPTVILPGEMARAAQHAAILGLRAPQQKEPILFLKRHKTDNQRGLEKTWFFSHPFHAGLITFKTVADESGNNTWLSLHTSGFREIHVRQYEGYCELKQ